MNIHKFTSVTPVLNAANPPSNAHGYGYYHEERKP